MAVTPPSPGPAVPTGAAPGRLVAGRYRLDSLVASGGMAQVWQATDEVLRRQVAVKVLHPHLAADDTFVTRFRREAVAAARLAHPSIVAIYDTCTEEVAAGAPMEAIVMELVRGRTLREQLDEGPVDPWQAAGIAAQVADALEVAHRAGLVHRDIKPANVLLCDDGRVKVADFGIAKAAEGADLTNDGLMVGTAKYLAPEQVTASAVDGRTDLYSLGIVLYEMLCGRAPFQADTDAATALARLTTEPMKPRQVRAGIPRELEAIVLKAMAREPDARFASAADLRGALLAASNGVSEEDLTLSVAPTATRDPSGASTATPRFTQSERAWLVPTLLVVLVAVSLVTAGLLFTDSGAGDLFDVLNGNTDPPAAQTITVARAFDPNGDNDEHDEQADFVRDGDAGTTWQTERYNSPDVATLKGGVGIAISLDSTTTLDTLEIDSSSEAWQAQVYIAGSMADALAGWGQPVETITGSDGEIRVPLHGRRGDSVLVWITNVGPSRVTEIAELRVLG